MLGAALVFGAPLSEAQTGAVAVVVNAALSLYIAATYKDSPKRVN